MAATLLTVWAATSASSAAPQKPASLRVQLLIADADTSTPLTVSGTELTVDVGEHPWRVAGGETQLPLSVVLVLDVSASVSAYEGLGLSADSPAQRYGQPLGRRNHEGGVLGRAVRQGFVARLRNVDSAAIGSVGAGDDRWWSAFSSDQRVLVEAARRAIDVPDEARYGASPIWDATIEAITLLRNAPLPRAVVLWTDGEATGNRASSSDVVEAAVAAGVTVNVVSEATVRRFVQSATTELVVDAGRRLREVADATGGLYVEDNGNRRDPQAQFARVLSALQQTQVIALEPQVRCPRWTCLSSVRHGQRPRVWD